ncbi:hypothetical protein BDY24DRAFT_438435 [Mrakia frigida]|uniref:uncharacterized protein n=1 Tax=Mrakia frigida TaxID=29902 RepID=UPI003FCC16D4
MPSGYPEGPSPVPHDLMIVADYADTLDALPLELTRGFSDLRELDAVLSSSLIHLTDSIKALTGKVLDPKYTPQERLLALREVADFAQRFKLGGEDKIRVVGGVCEGVISHQTHLNNLLLNSTLLTQRPSSPPGGSNVVYLPPTTSSKRTRTGANATLTTPLRKEKARKVANPDGGGRGGGKKDRETTEFMDEWYDSNSHKQSPGKGVASGSGRAGGGAKKKSIPRPASPALSSASHNNNPSDHPSHHPSPRLANSKPNIPARSRFDDDDGHPSSYPSPNPNGTVTNEHLTLVDSVTGRGHDIGAGIDRLDSPSAAANGGQGYDDDQDGKKGAAARARSRTNTNGHEGGSPSGTNNNNDEHFTTATGRPVRRPAAQQHSHDDGQRTFESESEESSDGEEDGQGGRGGPHDGGASGPEGGAAGGGGGGEGGDKNTYCYCNGASYGEMIGCDDDDCEIEWYHLDCLRLSAPPDGTWHCPTCSKRRAEKAAQKAAQRASGGAAGKAGRGRGR